MFNRWISLLLILAFLSTDVSVYAQSVSTLPAPGARVSLSPVSQSPLLKGIKVYPNDPFKFDFILDRGDVTSDRVLPPDLPSQPLTASGKASVSGVTRSDASTHADANRLIKYFLAALTIPENDLWVNLSPYEKDRIVPDAFGKTEMGRDLLAQDYILKQITASLMYPEGDVGKKFWSKVYAALQDKYGTTDIPVDTFNKVWIVPDKAEVYEQNQSAYVTQAHLKVMLEMDYISMQHDAVGALHATPLQPNLSHELTKNILRETILPILENEVNEGENFAQLRQVYHSLILATWYKRKIVRTLRATSLQSNPMAFYIDHQKTSGVDIADKNEKEKIWSQYVAAFKKGVFNYIADGVGTLHATSPQHDSNVPRQYFSGGADLAMAPLLQITLDHAALPSNEGHSWSVIQMQVAPVVAKESEDSFFLEHQESGQNGHGRVPFSLVNEVLEALVSSSFENVKVVRQRLKQSAVYFKEKGNNGVYFLEETVPAPDDFLGKFESGQKVLRFHINGVDREILRELINKTFVRAEFTRMKQAGYAGIYSNTGNKPLRILLTRGMDGAVETQPPFLALIKSFLAGHYGTLFYGYPRIGLPKRIVFAFPDIVDRNVNPQDQSLASHDFAQAEPIDHQKKFNEDYVAKAKKFFGDEALDLIDMDEGWQRRAEALRLRLLAPFESMVGWLPDGVGLNKVTSDAVLSPLTYLKFRVNGLYLQLTLKCNLLCLHCMFNAGPFQVKDMPDGVLNNALAMPQVWGHDIKAALGGGEPLLMDLIRIIERMTQNHIDIVTNARVFTTAIKAKNFIRAIKKMDDMHRWGRQDLLSAKQKRTRLSISLDELHGSDFVKVAWLINAVMTEYPDMPIGIKRLARFGGHVLDELIEYLKKRGYHADFEFDEDYLYLVVKGRNQRKSIFIDDMQLRPFGRAFVNFDDFKWNSSWFKEFEDESFLFSSNIVSVVPDGRITFESTFFTPYPYWFGDLSILTWNELIENAVKDPIFVAVSEKRARETLAFLLKRDLFFNDKRSGFQQELRDRGPDAGYYLYWLLIKPERKIYLTLRLLQEYFSEEVVGGHFYLASGDKPDFLSMPSDELERYVDRLVAQEKLAYSKELMEQERRVKDFAQADQINHQQKFNEDYVKKVKGLFGDEAIDLIDMDEAWQRQAEALRLKLLEPFDSMVNVRSADVPVYHNAFNALGTSMTYARFSLNLLYLQTTLRCNLGCLHCMFNAGPFQAKEMDDVLIAKALDVPARLRTGFQVTFGGGEPTLMNLPNMIDAVNPQGVIRVGFVTNASTFKTEKEAEGFVLALKESWRRHQQHLLKVRNRKEVEQFVSLNISLDKLHGNDIQKVFWLLKAVLEHYPQMASVTIKTFDENDGHQLTTELLRYFVNHGYDASYRKVFTKNYKKLIDAIAISNGKNEILMPISVSEKPMPKGRALLNFKDFEWNALWLEQLLAKESSFGMDGAAVFVDGRITLNGLMQPPYPYWFGDFFIHGWSEILENAFRDPIFVSLTAKNARKSVTFLTQDGLFASPVRQKFQAEILRKGPDFPQYLHWLFLKPERKIYVTLRLLQEYFSDTETVGHFFLDADHKPEFLRMPPDELERYVDQLVAKQKKAFLQGLSPEEAGKYDAAQKQPIVPKSFYVRGAGMDFSPLPASRINAPIENGVDFINRAYSKNKPVFSTAMYKKELEDDPGALVGMASVSRGFVPYIFQGTRVRYFLNLFRATNDMKTQQILLAKTLHYLFKNRPAQEFNEYLLAVSPDTTAMALLLDEAGFRSLYSYDTGGSGQPYYVISARHARDFILRVLTDAAMKESAFDGVVVNQSRMWGAMTSINQIAAQRAFVYEQLTESDIPLFKTTIDFIKNDRPLGIKWGIGSAGLSTRKILTRLGLASYFDVIVDGQNVKNENIPAKPSFDFYRTVALRMGVDPAKTVVVGDSNSDMISASGANFGLVVGVARENNTDELRANGAHVVVNDFQEISWDLIRKLLPDVEAIIFDNDGVIMDTEPLYFKASERVFNDYFRYREAVYGESFSALTLEESDQFLKGTGPVAGVKKLLEARGIHLPLDAAQQDKFSGHADGVYHILPESGLSLSRFSLVAPLLHHASYVNWEYEHVFKAPMRVFDHLILPSVGLAATAAFFSPLVYHYKEIPLFSTALTVVGVLISSAMVVMHAKEFWDALAVKRNARIRLNKTMIPDDRLLSMVNRFKLATGWDVAWTDSSYILTKVDVQKKMVYLSIGWVLKGERLHDDRRLAYLQDTLRKVRHAIHARNDDAQKGGIDLNPAMMDLNTKVNDGAVSLGMDKAAIERMKNAVGLTPIILSIQPLEDLTQFLGK